MTRLDEIRNECGNQQENCIYSAVSLSVWLRTIRRRKSFFIITPIILGGIASLSILNNSESAWLSPVLALIAGFFPAMIEGLKVDTHIEQIARLSAQFRTLRDEFRQVRNLTAPFDELAALNEIKSLMARLEEVRSSPVSAPEWAFEIARHKIMRGDYTNVNDDLELTSPDSEKPDPIGRRAALILAYVRSWMPV